MNRRQLFGWLMALPAVAAAAKAVGVKSIHAPQSTIPSVAWGEEVSGGGYARAPVSFPKATASWGDVQATYFSTPEGVWVLRDRMTELWTAGHSWLEGDQWSPAEQAIFKSRAGTKP